MIRSSRKLLTFCCVITQMFALALALQVVAAPAAAQQFDDKLYSGLQWRLIGPFRAGRVTAVAGIPGDPTTYYMGTPGGGVWKTIDGGIVWKPIFDDAHVASIGALALAPSDPNIIYVATGEQTDGNGVYKSIDAGKTWTNVGMREAKILNSIVVDPQNPNIVLVGASGGQPGSACGVYRTADGGKNWERVLFMDDKTGSTDLVLDPNDHKVLYAAMLHPPAPPTAKTTEKKEDPSGIYKSTDQGKSWKRLSGGELPAKGMGRIGLVVAPGNKGRRVFAIMNQGLFRSDNAGATWQRITTDPRVVGNWYFSRVFTDPKNPDIVYVMQTSLYRSTDGGKTFAAFRGAPGGDDYHVLWIDPANSQRIILGVDQGSTISLDGGKTFSPWYNQSTGQFYHVVTDNQFPYVAYAEQQDSGTVAVSSRSDFGRISYRDWFSVGGFEFGYIAPDPQNSNIVYSTGWFGTVVRFDKTTGQINTVFVPDKMRSTEPPMEFSPLDKRSLYIGTNVILKTADGGMTWKEISPDLTAKAEKSSEAGKNDGKDGKEDKDKDAEEALPPGRNRRITALSLSPVQEGVIWAGTSNGFVQLTRDAGATWTNVTPASLPRQTTIFMIESSHYDADTAYMAARARNDDHPYFYRTHDAGKSWQLIAKGLPDSMFARVVREDPVRRQMLYAGTENAVYVSFNDGDDWNPLQLNLPAASVRDLAIHGNDLVAATFGRALWVLDDVSPLRQFAPEVTSSEAYLFRPAQALRWRWDNNQETPLPPEVPTGDNPPDGAILDYYLKSVPAGEITLTITDAQGNVVQRYSSKAETAKDDMPKNVPDYWLAPPAVLPVKPGLNRFVWNLRYPSPPALRYGYFGEKLAYQEFTLTNGAVPGHTSGEMVRGPLAVPGQYEATLNVNGKTYRQAITVAMDPRVKASQSDLVEQFNLQRKIADALAETVARYNDVAALRKEVAERQKAIEQNSVARDANDALQKFAKNLDSLQTGNGDAPGYGVLNRELARLALMMEEGDAQPSATMLAAAQEKFASLEKVEAQWQKVKAEQVASLNGLLQKYQVAGLE